MQECMELALSRNLDIQIQHLSAEMARFALSGSYGPYVPIWSFRAGTEFVSQPGDWAPQKYNPDFPYELKTETVGSTLSGNLPIGLNYVLDGLTGQKYDRTDFSSDPDNGGNFFWGIRETNNYFADAKLTARQHLLRDFWIDQDRLNIRLARKDVQSSLQNLRFQVMRTVLAVELAYYDLATAQEEVRVEEKALEARRTFLNETKRRVQVGDLPPLDVEQAETQVQITLTALSLARERLTSRQNGLKALLTDNFAEWAETDLIPMDTLVALPPALDRAESSRKALETRPDLIQARIAIEKASVAVQFRYNQLFPTLDLLGRYGGLAVTSHSSEAMGDALQFNNPQYYYGVVLSFPLSNVAERNSYQSSKAVKQIAKLQLQKAEQEILLQIADWVNRAQSRYAQTDSARKARDYAEKAVAVELKKLANGLSTGFVVLQLQETLTQARTVEVQAKSEYNKALAQLAFAEGSILERNRIQVDTK